MQSADEALIFRGPSRARTKMRVEQVGWVETSCAAILDSLYEANAKAARSGVAVDEYRVSQAMDYGWRYNEVEGVRTEHMIGALQTSAWFSLDGKSLRGACEGADPEMDELPPMPYKRIALDCGKPPNKFFAIEIVNEEGQHEHLGNFYVPAVVVFEIEQGRWWDVLTNGYFKDAHTGETLHYGNAPLFGYHLTPGGHTADYAFLKAVKGWKDEQIYVDKLLGQALWKTVVTAVHMIEATNVVYTRLAPGRKQRRDWDRKQRYKFREPQIYRVDIVNYIGPEREQSKTREYHVRWMVRGHYRHSEHGEYLHPRTGLPATWVRPHVKGPADAPWKGRPAYRVPGGR